MEMYRFTAQQITEIESALQEATDQKIASRLAMLCLCAKGKAVSKVASDAGVSEQTVRRIIRKYKEDGLDAVIRQRSISQKRRDSQTFSPEQTEEIETAYRAAADENNSLWLQILYLRSKGMQVQEIAKTVGIRRQAVGQVILTYKEQGLDSLKKEECVDKRLMMTEFTPEQISELKKALGNAENERVKRRLRVLLALAEGQTVKDAAATVGLFPETVRKLYKGYQENGLAGLLPTRKTKHKRPFVAHKYHFTAQQKAEIEAARKTIMGGREAKKLEALWLRTEKKNLPEISAVTGIHTATITQLIRKYQEGGLDAAIKDGRQKPGKTSARRYMTYEEEETLLNQCCPPAKTSRIKKAFEEELGHSVSDAWLSNLLQRHHWHKCSVWLPPDKE